jgi:hypothetical protein
MIWQIIVEQLQISRCDFADHDIPDIGVNIVFGE